MNNDLKTNLMQFTGTENYYRNPFHGKLLYTDGVKYLAETAGAYWLIDLIASHQPDIRKNKDNRLHQMQFWNLTVHPNKSATATCRADSDVPPVVTQEISYTDFPMQEIDLWVVADAQGMVAMLKSEY
jgi:hypothetical protein